jgi:hypothetical protein
MLASELTRNNLIKSIMFWTFWGINATATFIFGFEFVGVVFAGLFATLPISLMAALTFANIAGGIAALAVLDLAYKGWQFQEMNTAETMAQVWIARVMAWLSFMISCSYSAIVLALGMPLLGLTAEQTTWIHLYGGFTFIAITILHLFAATVYQQGGIAHKERATLVNMSANMTTEQLDHIAKMNKQALLLMREDIVADIPTYANMHRELLGAKMREVLAPKDSRPDTPLLASSTAVTHSATASAIIDQKPEPASQPAPEPEISTAVPIFVGQPTAVVTPTYSANGNGTHGAGSDANFTHRPQ